MDFSQEAFSVVKAEDGMIIIEQPKEECPMCLKSSCMLVWFSASGARLIAAELVRLADELEGCDIDDGEGFFACCEKEDKANEISTDAGCSHA